MFGDRINRSWQVAKDSYAVLKANPSLALFPVISGVATVIVSIPFIVALSAAYMAGKAAHPHTYMQNGFSVGHYALTAAMYFCTYFVVIFFNSALVACAHESLQGRPTSIGYGIDMAIKRLPQILGWTLIASTVGLILRMIGERTGIVGAIVTSLIGMVWNIAVFFVVPCLVIDKESPIAALKSSTAMLKQTWGERIILGVGVSTVFGLIGLFVIFPIVVGILLLTANLIALGLILFVVAALFVLTLAIVGSAITTIYQTALYLYSRHGTIPEGFNADYMRNAFQPKPPRKFFAR